jgi:hypothetical protein
MGNVATNMPRGLVIDMESFRTSSAEAAEGPTFSKIPSGLVTTATALYDTKARSGVELSDAERSKLANIRRNRAKGWMATFEEFDALLAMVEKLSQ